MSLSSVVKKLKLGERSDLLVTPKVEEFLRKHPDGVIWDEDGHELFRSLTAAGFDGNSDRSGRFGASSRGTCQRRQLFTFMGMPEGRILDPDTLNLFNDGKWRHLRWQMMLIQSGACTHAEYPLEMKKYRLRSSVDALNSIDAFIFELKGDRNMSRLMDGMDNPDSVVAKHKLQIHTMFLMTGWDLASYVMEDKATQQFREIVIRRDPALIHEVRIELEELNEHVEDRSLPAVLPACQSKEGPYRTCPFGPQCLDRARTGDYWPDLPGDWDS